jgi:hypothetical protein
MYGTAELGHPPLRPWLRPWQALQRPQTAFDSLDRLPEHRQGAVRCGPLTANRGSRIENVGDLWLRLNMSRRFVNQHSSCGGVDAPTRCEHCPDNGFCVTTRLVSGLRHAGANSKRGSAQ